MDNATDDLELIDAKRLASLLGVGLSTIERMRVAGKLPASVLIGRNRRYPISKVKKWMHEIVEQGQASLS